MNRIQIGITIGMDIGCVETPRAASLTVTPTSVLLAHPATRQLTATANYDDGSTANVTATSTWSSSNESAATVDAAGLVTSVAAGSTTITTTFGSLTDTTPITVV